MDLEIDIDPALMAAAMEAGPFGSESDAVTAGLRLISKPAAYAELLKWEGRLKWEDGEDDAWKATEVVRRLWSLFQTRDWPAARALLHDDATMHWVTSGEHLLDADAIIRVNNIYPEGWSIQVISVDPLVNGDVHSIVEVQHGDNRFFANSRFELDGDLIPKIRRITEYWATFEPPPAWRTAEAIGAYRREPL